MRFGLVKVKKRKENENWFPVCAVHTHVFSFILRYTQPYFVECINSYCSETGKWSENEITVNSDCDTEKLFTHTTTQPLKHSVSLVILSFLSFLVLYASIS